MIGRVIAGRYELISEVGHGGMAVVYMAADRTTKKTVAVKVLKSEYQSDEEFVRRFNREAKAANRVSHENIVYTMDVGVEGDLQYIVMEYVDGCTLKDLIRQKGHFRVNEAVPMVIRILAAVDHAHKNGIVHRDIKPQNILVDRRGIVKVTDFGIARLVNDTTSKTETDGERALGSVHYFSPEQARGQQADAQSDLYSVGVVLYEMLTGRVPFDGRSIYEVARQHLESEPVPMRQIQTGITKALDEVVHRAMCKDPARRYQTAAEFAADLKLALEHPKGGFVIYPGTGAAEEKKDAQTTADRDSENRTENDEDHGKSHAARILTVVGISLVAVFIVLLGWYIFHIHGRVKIPAVTGMTQSEAQSALDRLGLVSNVEEIYDEEFARGIVVSQSVTPGTWEAPGTVIDLRVSRGSQWFYMENYIGRTEREAVEALNSSGVNRLEILYSQDSGTIGTVIAQDPEPGYQSVEDPVTLTVSGQVFEMPDLAGLTLDGAIALLEAEGLRTGGIQEIESDDAKAGAIVGQSVVSGSDVLQGTSVDLTVCVREQTAYHPCSAYSVVVPLENLLVSISLDGPTGEESIVFSGRLSRGTHMVELTGIEPGVHLVRVYIEGVLIDQTEINFE